MIALSRCGTPNRRVVGSAIGFLDGARDCLDFLFPSLKPRTQSQYCESRGAERQTNPQYTNASPTGFELDMSLPCSLDIWPATLEPARAPILCQSSGDQPLCIHAGCKTVRRNQGGAPLTWRTSSCRGEAVSEHDSVNGTSWSRGIR